MVQTCPPEALTVYPVIGEPPSDAGAVHETAAPIFPAMAVTALGAPGLPIRGFDAPAGALVVSVKTAIAIRTETQILRVPRPHSKK